jgi:hypothetical protein
MAPKGLSSTCGRNRGVGRGGKFPKSGPFLRAGKPLLQKRRKSDADQRAGNTPQHDERHSGGPFPSPPLAVVVPSAHSGRSIIVIGSSIGPARDPTPSQKRKQDRHRQDHDVLEGNQWLFPRRSPLIVIHRKTPGVPGASAQAPKSTPAGPSSRPFNRIGQSHQSLVEPQVQPPPKTRATLGLVVRLRCRAGRSSAAEEGGQRLRPERPYRRRPLARSSTPLDRQSSRRG